MGSVINLSAVSNFGIVYLDIDHPSYGINYSSDSWLNTINITINWFRKILFNNGYTTQNLTYNSVNFTSNQTVLNTSNFNVEVHQYDLVNNLSVNITGDTNEGNSTTKHQVVFYKANTSTIDRIFYGDLIGNNIYTDKVFDNSNGTDLYLNTTNVSFENEGNQLVYFYLDDNADLVNFILNITGFDYGFTFDSNDFITYKDSVLTNATTISNFIFPSKTGTSNWLNYGGFSNATLWEFTLDDYSSCEENTGYCEDYSTFKGSSSMWAYSDLTDDMSIADEFDSESISSFINLFNYTDVLSPFALENVTISFGTSIVGEEIDTINPDRRNRCTWDFELSIGGTKILDLDEDHRLSDDYLENQNCLEQLGDDCFFYGSSDVTVTISKNKEDSTYLYTYIINGTEDYEAENEEEDYFYRKYYNNGTYAIWATIGFLESGSLVSRGEFSPVNTNVISMRNRISGTLSTAGGEIEKCEEIFLNNSVINVSVKLNSYENSSYISTSVFDSSANINKINITVTGVFNGTTKISGDFGENWQETVGVENNIDDPGKNILWWQKFTPDSGYLAIVPYVSNVLILSEKGDPSNVSLDFGDDDTYDYTMSGYLNGTNQTLIVNLTNADISGAFTGDPLIGQTWLVPLRVFSSSAGIVNLNTINLTYDPNPVYLNVSAIQNYIDDMANFSVLNISVGSINGTINLTDLRYDYLGGNDTIKITAHNADYSVNISRWITYYYSSFIRRLPYIWTDNIFFLPRTNSSKNVSAYGQTSTKPILNITTTNYGGMESNLSLRVDQSYACLNLTWGDTNTIPTSGNKINTTWQDIVFNLGYLNNQNIWIWADLVNCDPSDTRILSPILNISTSCEDCIWN